MDAKEFAERLEKYPALKASFEKMLNIAENSDGTIVLADDAEEMIIANSRALNQDAMRAWAENQNKKQSNQFERRHQGANKAGKKNSNGIPPSEK